ncbi:DUF7363 domain-containing protein [Nocardioides immobilis]|uniref:DUF7363 domain-containing protein n=1 Tax=Nocardioides immobilis TaxID=2049295 RepID=UPI0011C3E93F|nr:hypothetical protein [Nocardioides immobilis]
MLVAVGGRYHLVPESRRRGRERTFTLEISAAGTEQVVVIEHTAGLVFEDLPGPLPELEDFWRRETVLPRQFDRTRRARAEPPPMDGPIVAGGGGPLPEEIVRESFIRADEMAEAIPDPPPEPAQAVLAEVGANMPSEVHLDDTVPVEVLLSRKEVSTFAGTSHDEQVIVMDPDKPLDLVLLRRGFDLDAREVPFETGRRSLHLSSEDASEVKVVFWLRAAQEGVGEVQASSGRTTPCRSPRSASRQPCCPRRTRPGTAQRPRRPPETGLPPSDQPPCGDSSRW